MVKKIKKCIYGNFGETVSGTGKSITNIYSQKTLSSIKPKIETNRKPDLAKTKSSAIVQQNSNNKNQKQQSNNHQYKNVNPEDKVNKVLILASERK